MNKIYGYTDEYETKYADLSNLNHMTEEEAMAWIEGEFGEGAFEEMKSSTVLDILLFATSYFTGFDRDEARELLMTPVCMVDKERFNDFMSVLEEGVIEFTRTET